MKASNAFAAFVVRGAGGDRVRGERRFQAVIDLPTERALEGE
ncbi:MAG: hypothetical protein WBO23_02030 [Burkholderiales bacterium]